VWLCVFVVFVVCVNVCVLLYNPVTLRNKALKSNSEKIMLSVYI
jgi:hypothetical protein